MSLLKEIEAKRHHIRTDAVAMTVGELMNLYQFGDLEIHPAFQRDFRWTLTQKTRLIESLLLDIPIPSLYVAERKDRVWEVIDGSQRLSTLFQFTGLLKGADGERVEPFRLLRADYLISLEGKVWDTFQGRFRPEDVLETDIQRALKRAKLDVKVLVRDSDQAAKYELFQRLNTAGTQLSAQEVRNCALVAVDEPFMLWLEDLSRFEPFRHTLALTDYALEQKYDQELALRFLVQERLTPEVLKGVDDFASFLTLQAQALALDTQYDRQAAADRFRALFQALDSALGADAFRKFDPKTERFSGGFMLSVFEVITAGFSPHWEVQAMRERVLTLWRNRVFLRLIQSSRTPAGRLRVALEFARNQASK
jgi:hypothetical protein